MPDFAALSEVIKKRLEDDRDIKSVEIEMPTLEEAVEEAAATLGLRVSQLDYEILLRKTAFLGFGENRCRIRGYERADLKRKKREEEIAARAAAEARAAAVAEADDMELAEDLDGEVFVKRLARGVYIKVTQPLGEGVPATFEEARRALEKACVSGYDEGLARAAVRERSGEYERVGDYAHNQANDAAMSVDVTQDEMRAFIYVTQAGPGGADVTYEQIKQMIEMNGVAYGLSDAFLRSFADKPIYKEKICVAKGSPAVNGLDSYMQYFFETDQSKIKLKESADGRIDFKETNIIQNVRQDDKIAVWNSSEEGRNGRTVTGKILIAEAGKDGTFELGSNVCLAPDGQTILAKINGQVLLANGKISVEPLLEIKGDVGLKTGNIEFLGNVSIKGDVIEGFTVKVTGNVDVNGTVNKATIIAGGDIIVKQGIYGKEDAVVKSGRSVWAKFVENASVKSGNMVIVSDGIVNCYVDAAKKIICSGKRASIVGGRLRAGEEINCKTLGSPGSSTETVCEVAFDPESRERIESLTKEKEEIMPQLDEVLLNSQSLEERKKQKGGLPDAQEEFLRELRRKKYELAARIQEIDNGVEELQEYLRTLTATGRVSAQVKVYPGVIISIRDIKDKVHSEYKATSFILENNMIRVTKYIESGDPIPPKPEREK